MLISRLFSLAGAALALAGAAPAQLAINEVLVDPRGANPGSQIVEITNVSGAPFTPTGWQICVPFVYAPLPSIAIPSGGTVQLHIGAGGSDTSTDFFFPLFAPLATADTFLIYRSANFLNSADIIDFVSWGGGIGRINQAVSVGQWPSTSATVPLPAREGQTIAWAGHGDSNLNWFRDASPTLGASNGAPTLTALGTGCATSAGLPGFAHPTPAVDGNLDYTLHLQGGPAGAAAAFLLGGGASGGIALLGPCDLEVFPLLLIAPAALDSSGSAALALPVFAGGLNLSGASVFFQALVVDPGAPSGLIGMSAGLRIDIG